jgi:transposase InsO family protein
VTTVLFSRVEGSVQLVGITGWAKSSSHRTRPEQNGIIERSFRSFRSFKEECAWQYKFGNFMEAKNAVAQWIEWYNVGRPHQPLGYKSLREYRAQERMAVA